MTLKTELRNKILDHLVNLDLLEVPKIHQVLNALDEFLISYLSLVNPLELEELEEE